ncbi:hypothetical protein ABPG74_011083 [Tetrahymena malaccensis]
MKKPFTSISLSTGVILGLGDVLEQYIEKKSTKAPKPFELRRVLNMSAYGLTIYGPFCSLWYTKWLPSLAPLTPTPALKQLSLKILYDETLQSGFFYMSFLYTLTRLEGGSHQQGKDKVKRDFFRCYLADLAVWPWIQYVNFRYVPPHLQAIVVSTLTVFWGAYISYVQHS